MSWEGTLEYIKLLIQIIMANMANIYVLGALPSIHLILMGTRRRVLLLQWLLVNDTWMAKHFPHKNPNL